MIGRSTVPPAAPPSAPPPAVPPSVTTPAPSTPQILDRAAIIELGQRGADALASGTQPPAESAKSVGRRFALALPFGCSGPAGADSTAPMRWRYDDSSHTLRIQISETIWEAEDWGLPPTEETHSRGFWISHPWSSGDRCPTASADPSAVGPGPVILPGQTLALATFAATDVAPQPKPLEAVIKLKGDNPDLSKGLRAQITGRIDQAPGVRGPVRCVQPAGIEQQPICAVAVTFDELTVENPATGETLATWNLGR